VSSFQNPTERYRPIFPGISVGHYSITAGTIGFKAVDESAEYILSNNHVLAASNKGKAGDPILQPGPYDGGSVASDIVGNLTRFVEIVPDESPSGCKVSNTVVMFLNFISKALGRKTRFNAIVTAQNYNRVDCAVAKLSVEMTNIPNGLSAPAGVVDAPIGTRVIKSGRTTGITKGTIVDDDAVVKVDYGDFTATFEHQYIVKKVDSDDSDIFIKGGDSGSGMLVLADNSAAGLLFAGSDVVGIANHLTDVLTALGVELA
jgi:hypothetical protein